jgi:hypothetical protein
MKRHINLNPLLVLALLLVGTATGCGGAGTNTDGSQGLAKRAAGSGGATTSQEAGNDAEDGDFLTPQDRDDDGEVVEYGHPATPADVLSVTVFAKSYLAAAAAEDGETACSLMVASVSHTLVRKYGRASNARYLKGNVCAEVMSKLFTHEHERLTVEHAGAKVTGVRISGNRAYALLAFTTMPERRYLTVEREGDAWKLTGELVDSPYP